METGTLTKDNLDSLLTNEFTHKENLEARLNLLFYLQDNAELTVLKDAIGETQLS
jgi:hypothetical protein